MKIKHVKQSISAISRCARPYPFIHGAISVTVLAAIAAMPAYAADVADSQSAAPIVVAQTTPPGSSPQAKDANSSSSQDHSSMAVITVTASKRRERLLDTPTAISALKSETLENLGVDSFANYASLVPSLNQVGGAAQGQGTIVMRGLYSGAQQVTNTTSFYLGETPFTASGSLTFMTLVTPDPDLMEVERVEVLKGPQGTLYGASSLGGLIRVVPKLPDTNESYGSVRLGASKIPDGGNGYTGRMLVNVPVEKNMLGLQVGAFKRQDGGFTTNTWTGAKDLGESQSEGGSLTALLTPTKGLEISLRTLTQKIDSRGFLMQDNVQGTGTPVTGERQYASPFSALPTKSKYELVELNTQYTTDIGAITATWSQSKVRLDANVDVTRSYGQLFSAAGAYCLGFKLCAPANYTALFSASPSMTKESGEVRFVSRRLDNFEFLAGAFYTKEDDSYPNSALGKDGNGNPAPAPFDVLANPLNLATYKEDAVFGNLTYYISNAFDLSAGVRYAKNKQNGSISRSGLLYGANPKGSPSLASSDNSTTYQLTARWRPATTLSTYARVATGYRPGGPQTNPNPPAGTPAFFDPDRVTNYEAGVKGTALDGRMNFDTALYHIDWKKIQLNTLFGGVILWGNGGKATVDGFEAQINYAVPSGFSFGGSLGYNDAKLTEVGATTAASIGAATGDALPGSPKITGALFGDYHFPVFGNAKANIGATLRHQGKKPSTYPGDKTNSFYEIPAYSTLDLRAGIKWSRYSLRFGIDNVSDKNGITGYSTTRILASQTVASNAYLIRPRTVSLTFDMDF